MFNTFLDNKRKMIVFLFWWVMFFATLFLGIIWYKWTFPLIRVETKVIYREKQIYIGKYETRIINDFSSLHNGDLVKMGRQTYCVSSIEEVNQKTNTDRPVAIYLRTDTTKCQGQ